jgi:hypothetical protein
MNGCFEYSFNKVRGSRVCSHARRRARLLGTMSATVVRSPIQRSRSWSRETTRSEISGNSPASVRCVGSELPSACVRLRTYLPAPTGRSGTAETSIFTFNKCRLAVNSVPHVVQSDKDISLNVADLSCSRLLTLEISNVFRLRFGRVLQSQIASSVSTITGVRNIVFLASGSAGRGTIGDMTCLANKTLD